MNAKRLIGPVFLLACLILLLIACQSAQPEAIEVTRIVVETVTTEGGMVEVTRVVEQTVVETVVVEVADESDGVPEPIGTAVHQTAQQQRLIIKNAA